MKPPYRLQLPKTVSHLQPVVSPRALAPLDNFGTNPGNLDGFVYVPPSVGRRPALVVVLHGCTQNAQAYDRGAGWTHAADENGFIVLFPEQARANNPNLCFNWFSPRHARRDRGEALSIIQMVDAAIVRFDADPARVFVTGLSAGGAMTAVMLAAYPERFAGGAIIAGLPFATANNVPQALERMRGQDLPEGPQLSDVVRSASGHEGPWPTVSIWHGTNDTTVHRRNAQAIVDQWRAIHGVSAEPTRSERVQGHVRHMWRDASGRDVLEEYQIAGLGHGTPLSTHHLGSDEIVGPHMLEAGISSTTRILHFWGLVDDDARDAAVPPTGPAGAQILQPPPRNDIQTTIENALQAAGLLR